MLVLTRRVGERLYLGEHICLTVLEITGQQVRLGITAPPEVSIQREELRRPRPLRHLVNRPCRRRGPAAAHPTASRTR